MERTYTKQPSRSMAGGGGMAAVNGYMYELFVEKQKWKK